MCLWAWPGSGVWRNVAEQFKAHELPLAGSEGIEGGLVMQQATYPSTTDHQSVHLDYSYPDAARNLKVRGYTR
jgi:hypothetical protein